MVYKASDKDYQVDSLGVGIAPSGTTGTAKIGVGANYAEFKADGEINLHGTARAKRGIWVPASGLRSPSIKPATWADLGMGGVWQFSDGADDKIVATIKMPEWADLSEDIDIVLGWSSPGVGDAHWDVEHLLRQVGELMDDPADGTASIDITNSGAQELMVSIIGSITPNAADVCISLRVTRDGTGGSGDTIADDVNLHGACIYLYLNKLGTAT
jgi:hypothetical protein